jgi:cell division protein FtsB
LTRECLMPRLLPQVTSYNECQTVAKLEQDQVSHFYRTAPQIFNRVNSSLIMFGEACIMIVKSRKRAILTPLILYAVAGSLAAFFIHHAHSGERGLENKLSLKAEAFALNSEIEKLKLVRTEWEHRITMIRDEATDSDLLEERARILLGYGHRNDVIILDTLEAKSAK